jgi:copper chaperone CopZ
MSNIVLEVPDISCAHCAHTITSALQGQPGVESVQVDIPAKVVHLSYDENALSLDQVGAILDEEGYPVAGSHAESAAPAPRRNVIPLTGQ